MKSNCKKSFTLIELLIVIGIIAILTATVLIAINPARQFAQVRNARRWSDINAILNAIQQYAIDNRGLLPGIIPFCPTERDVGIGDLNLKATLVPTYIADIPFDPLVGNATTTNYLVCQGPEQRLKVRATRAELDAPIEVMR